MTVSADNDIRLSYTGSGTTGPFTTPYFLANADIKAVKVLISDGTETLLVLTTDYTLTGAGDSDGGALTLVSSLSSSYRLVIINNAVDSQEVEYPANDPFPSATHQAVVDRRTMVSQRLTDRIDRALRQPDGDATAIGAFPALVERASKTLGFDASGEPTVYDPESAVTESANISFIHAAVGAVAETVMAALRRFKFAVQYGTLAQAVTASSGGTLRVDTTVNVATNTTVDATVGLKFEKGGIIKPASGVTVTINGPLQAGMHQIFDLSAGGHVDLTDAEVDVGFPEWWGVVGGDGAYSSGNAAINKPLIDEVLTYGPYELHWKQPGIYSTTGHIMNVAHKHVGLGKSSANCIYGDGILFSDNAHMVTRGATLAGKKYVFQNGANGGPPIFEYMSILGDPTDCIALGILPSSTAALEWGCDAYECQFQGYIGRHLGWANRNLWESCVFIGAFACTADTIWDDDSGLTSAYGYVQKQLHVSCIFSQSQVASGRIIYQDRVGSSAPYSNAISNNAWDLCDFEYGYDGFLLAGFEQVFNEAHVENLNGATLLSEATQYNSVWNTPFIAQGAGSLAVDVTTLLAQKSSQSCVGPLGGATVLSSTGFSAVLTPNVRWTITPGKVQMATLNIPDITGTSNATSKTLATLPAYLRPRADAWGYFAASDNGGAYVVGLCIISTAGVVTLYATAGAGNWTASGTATIANFSITYSLT